MWHARSTPRRLATTATALAVALALTATSAAAQTAPGAIPEAQIDDLVGFSVDGLPFTDGDPWIDPVTLAGLDPNDLAPAPDFDRNELHKSEILAAGVDLVPTQDSALDELADRHVRVLQTLATLDRDIAELNDAISDRRPTIDRLISRIADEISHEARLAEEIALLERAVAEFAVRAFIFEDDVDAAFPETDNSISETRIITDEVRDDQFARLEAQRGELARREQRRMGHESDLVGARSELRTLRRERLDLLGTRREIERLTSRTAATYHVALHEQLPQFVAGTNIPLVALNAYVIAARTLADERPQCGIRWSMLAGIGHVESFHGHFGDSTLDINGHTTEDIRGLPLDGRILEGAELIGPDGEAPDPTTRTEVLPIPQTPGEGEPPTELAPEPVLETPPQPQPPAQEPAQPGPPPPPAPASPSGGDETSDGADQNTPEAPPTPAPVVRRLALIEDTDGGELDGDTVFDRAVGPMQFIPSTWRLFEQDGNLDGELDPQNIYDAALASARYLCASTSTMTTIEGELRAYFAYNHDTQYSQNVLRAGLGYAEDIDIAEPDVAGELGDPDEQHDTSGTNPLGLATPEQTTITADLARIRNDLAELGIPDIAFE